jgi:hypothetical protein
MYTANIVTCRPAYQCQAKIDALMAAPSAARPTKRIKCVSAISAALAIEFLWRQIVRVPHETRRPLAFRVAFQRMRFVALLKGGLGNQLFQYAMARNLALRFGGMLAMDTRTGFLLDRQYRRRYELRGFPIEARVAGFAHSVRWLSSRAFAYPGHRPLPEGISARSWGLGGLLVEPSGYRPLNIVELPDSDWTICGYWQNPRYFLEFSEQISRELMPPEPARPAARALGRELEAGDFLSIGLRLYEETADPNAHARGGSLKSVTQVGEVVREVLAKRPGLRCILFCSHTPRDLHLARLPKSTVLATPETGFRSASESLWLMTRCAHHVLTNSTLYWWGAWLSRFRDRRQGEAIVMAADNFVNPACLPPSWGRF